MSPQSDSPSLRDASNSLDFEAPVPEPAHSVRFCMRLVAMALLAVAGFIAGLAPSVPSAFAQRSTTDERNEKPTATKHARQATEDQAPLVTAVTSIGLTVDDMERSIAFYRDVLSFSVVCDIEVAGEPYEHLQGIFGLRMRIVMMKLGDELIELTEHLVPKGRPIPQDSRSNDRWFQHIAIITSDMDRAYRWLRHHKVRHASTGPQLLPSWNTSAGGIQAFYFHDPDGHVLEILQFPPDKGAAKWRQRAAAASADMLFLGIDHTAIVVDDTARSLRFYRDLLGMEIAGESENYGTEQEHLNNVFGARLRITSVRPANLNGPAVELLEYLAPGDGRDYPPDARSNDLIHWQTTLITENLDRLVEMLIAAKVQWITSGSRAVALPDRTIGFTRAAIVRDPDGHAVRIIER